MMTPERAWELMRRGVKRRLNANLTELMQQFEADDEPSSGKPGWAMRLADAEVRRAKDAAQRCYEACRTEWKKQNRTESFAFFEAVYKYGLIPLISERNLDAERRFKGLTARVNKRNGVNRRTALARTREIDAANQRRIAGLAILRRGWRDQIENDQRDCNLGKRLRRAAVKKGKIRKPGPKVKKKMQEFRVLAAKLWREQQDESRRARNGEDGKFRPHLTLRQLKEIAVALDVAGFTPPHLYLEGKKLRTELSERNSNFGNTKKDAAPADHPVPGAAKPPAILKWVHIANGEDQRLIKAMRTVLSRCASLIPPR
jgi:hypothetical protein